MPHEIRTHPFDYTLVATARRSRRPERWLVRETFEAPVPAYPEAAGRTGHAASALSDVFPDVALIEGRIFASTARRKLRTADQLGHDIELYGENTVNDPYSLTIGDGRPDGRGPTRDARDRADLRDVVEDDREVRRALASVDVAHLCTVEGILHSARWVPVVVRTTPTTGYPFRWTTALADSFDLDRRLEGSTVLDPATFLRRFPDKDIPALDALELLVDQDVRNVFPSRHHATRALLTGSIESVFLPHRRKPPLGSGSFSTPDLPESLDEAVFDLVRSLREIDVDLRAGPPSHEAYARADGRLETFAETYASAMPLHSNVSANRTRDFLSDLRDHVRTTWDEPGRKAAP